MLRIINLIFCFYIISCQNETPSEETDLLPKANIVKGMACSELEKLYEIEFDLKMVAIGRSMQEKDNDTVIYYTTVSKDGIHRNFNFNKEKELLGYSKRFIRNEKTITSEKGLPQDIEWGMSFDEISKIYSSKNFEFVKLIEDFMKNPPADTVCYLYHCDNLIFEFDYDMKLYSINKVIF